MADASGIGPGDSPGHGVWKRIFTGEPPPLGLHARLGGKDALWVRAVVAAAADASMDPVRREVLEGLALLWHGRWEEAHGIAQSREGARDFDLLHAILHRGEGDFANAGYWFRAVGKHPCYAGLERGLADSLPEGPLRRDLLPGGRWSPSAFIAKVRSAGGEAEDLVRVQSMEFRAFAGWLLDY